MTNILLTPQLILTITKLLRFVIGCRFHGGTFVQLRE